MVIAHARTLDKQNAAKRPTNRKNNKANWCNNKNNNNNNNNNNKNKNNRNNQSGNNRNNNHDQNGSPPVIKEGNPYFLQYDEFKKLSDEQKKAQARKAREWSNNHCAVLAAGRPVNTGHKNIDIRLLIHLLL